MSRRLTVFRDEGARIGEPHELCAAVFFDDATGEIEAHISSSAIYAFAYLVEVDNAGALTERLIGRRCDHEGMDPSVLVGRVCEGEAAIAAGLADDQRRWKRYDRELDRVAMAQELQRTVKP